MGGSHYSEEFPLLAGVGLYASDISGDGNCLFHALSDQIYGHENNHEEIRERVVEHMRTHAEYFKLFLDVDTTRRAPKRKAHAAGISKSTASPTGDTIDRAFAQHLKTMSQPGVYGDNMEISAFAREYNCDVKIYQREFAYVVSGGDGPKKTAHIAYHTWEHYSSIRNRDGPHTGPPNVTPATLTEEGRREQERKLAGTSYVLPWMEGVVASSLPHTIDPAKIRQMLEKCKGNVDEVVSQLLDEDEADGPGSTPQGGVASKPTPTGPIRECGGVAVPEDVGEAENFKGSKDKVGVGKSKKKQHENRSLTRLKGTEGKTLGNDSSNNSCSANEPQKQPTTQKQRQETKREKKMKQKEAKKLRDREKATDKNKEIEGTAATITVGIKELHV